MTPLSIYCTNTGRYYDAQGGETLLEIAARIPLGFTPFAAHVNNKTESLAFPLYANKKVEFLPVTAPSSQRMYVRSLCMMLYRATVALFPGRRLRIEHSISKGYYCRILDAEGRHTLTPDDVVDLKKYMADLARRAMPFERREEPTEHVIKIFQAQGLDDKVRLLQTTHNVYTTYYRLDGLCDSYYGPLAPDTSHLATFDLRPYKDGMLLLGPDPVKPFEPASPITQDKMYKAFTDYVDFNHVLGITSVGDLNLAVEHRHSGTLITVAETLHDKYLGRISDEIAGRYHQGGARIVLVAGPSSSGKTTTTKRLAVQLMTNLLRPQMISLDNYFVDRERTPRDTSGDYDYESLYALDLEAFNRDLNDILAGKEVKMPTYNFELGRRTYKGDTIRLHPGGILLIEGIHGLNPELTAHIPDQQKYRVYVSALTTLSIDDHNWIPTTDCRLLRRIIRDHKYRGTSALDTIRRWPSVRRGEERWIFPYQENADATFNSSLLFELGVLKEQAEDILGGVPRDVPEYAEAYRLRSFLGYFLPIPDRQIPSMSLLREFLGGSSFHY